MNIFEILGRLLEAIAKVVRAWPSGEPVDLSTFLLEVLRVATVDELATKVSSIVEFVVKAPRIIGTVFDSILFLLFFGVGTAIVSIYTVWYLRAYKKISSAEGGMERILDGESPVVEMHWYFLRILIILPFLVGSVSLMQLMFNGYWEGIRAVLKVIFTGDESLGGTAVELVWRMMTGANAFVVVMFLSTFLLLLVLFIAVFIKRYIALFTATVKLYFGLLEFAKGKRSSKIMAKLGPFLKDLGKFAMMVLLVAFSFKILSLTKASGSVTLIAMLLIFVFSWWIPRLLMNGVEKFLEETDVDDFIKEIESEQKVNNLAGLKKAAQVGGSLIWGGLKLIPEVAPFAIAGEAVYNSVQHISKPGGGQAAVKVVSKQVTAIKKHVDKTRTAKERERIRKEAVQSQTAAGNQVEGDSTGQPASEAVTTQAVETHNVTPEVRTPVAHRTGRGPSASVETNEEELEEQVKSLIRTLPLSIQQEAGDLDLDEEMNDAILGWLAGLFFYDPPTDPVDEVKEKAREVCSELKARGSSKFERLATSGKAIRENLEGE